MVRSKLELGWIGLVALAVVLTLEVRFFPQLATWIYVVASGRPGWDGSALPAIQAFGALPAAIALLAMTLYLCRRVERPDRRGRIVLSMGIASFVLLLSFVALYAAISSE